jgi:hypothetical protein
VCLGGLPQMAHGCICHSGWMCHSVGRRQLRRRGIQCAWHTRMRHPNVVAKAPFASTCCTAQSITTHRQWNSAPSSPGRARAIVDVLQINPSAAARSLRRGGPPASARAVPISSGDDEGSPHRRMDHTVLWLVLGFLPPQDLARSRVRAPGRLHAAPSSAAPPRLPAPKAQLKPGACPLAPPPRPWRPHSSARLGPGSLLLAGGQRQPLAPGPWAAAAALCAIRGVRATTHLARCRRLYAGRGAAWRRMRR